MNKLEILRTAIKGRYQISFEYNKEGKKIGKRIGNPYAVFMFTAKNGAKSTKVHIVQTDGVSDSIEINPFPSFRTYNIEDLIKIELLEDLPKFQKPYHKDYNPEWDGYKDVFEKI